MIECLDCGHQAPFEVTSFACLNCGGLWREARYDYAKLAGLQGKDGLFLLVEDRPFDLWRYRELLPVQKPIPALCMGEGGTPLIHAANLGTMLGCPHIYIKDERQGPTSSFKDRQAAVNIAALKEAGITEAVLASTGNVAIAYSAYAARAGIKLWTFLTSLVPAEKMREVALYGSQVVKVTASYDQTKQVAAEFARQRGLYLERGSRSIPSVEAMKTIAFEIVEQLSWEGGNDNRAEPAVPGVSPGNVPGSLPRSKSPWRSPDWYIQAVSGGLGPQGVLKGFDELHRMGLIDCPPAMANIQTEGCAPMVHAWQNNLEKAEPIQSPRTSIATLSTGDPGRTYTLLRHRMLAGSGGVFEAVTDEEAFRMIHILAKMEGLSVEPAAAVAFAGLIKLVRAGKIRSTDVVVVNCSGHTMPVEKMILGEGWSRNLTAAMPAGRPVDRCKESDQAADKDHPPAWPPDIDHPPAWPPDKDHPPAWPPDIDHPGKEESDIMDSPVEGLLAALNRITAERYARVAIVDDTIDSRQLIRRILQSQGPFMIYEATNGVEAIELVRKELPDLVILDLMMPEVDGFSVLDAMQSDVRTASIPVIVVTAKELTIEEKIRLRGRIHALMQKGEFINEDLGQVIAWLKSRL
jgi:threonine synthase